ncbi:2-polyprenylphenol 6-hydroxylase [Notoacmeibacter ruber]|uniref:2-polyprenylphenol 6-hydroxylase n=1 Tax=Notoacmeibacter ruber TaxID=2670375 RepID=A0A3L7JL67_9HYPH|nr:2-polyprenylphenol 6-hydroxylase [Notoacmeibacter ruber]RLQ89262.1 2-polyprenylphenol 6-hydroxylase [Notoacmeibacter ruber]
MTAIGAQLRLMRAGWIFAREGVVAALPGDQLDGMPRFFWRIGKSLARPRSHSRDRATRISRAIERLGPSYVKLGQFLATRPDIVGTELARDLSLLHDRMETFPVDQSRRTIEESIGRPCDELFVELRDPVAAASIAQVHPAILYGPDGRNHKVAVKVIRPGVRRRFYNDLESFFLAARMLERFVPATRRLHPVEIANTLAQTTRMEMDLRLEAAALSELAENTQDDPGFRTPAVDWERTGRDIVTMEWIDGIKLSDTERLRASGLDLSALAVCLIQSFLRHAMRDGFFHADMHPGNLFVEADGTLVAVDLGISGRLGNRERRFLADILYGFIIRDYRRVADVHFEAGYVPKRHDPASFAQAIRAIGEPIHGQSAETISMAKLLTLLFEVTELFDMETRTELIMLQKTMVTVEGVARTLDPHFNMWKAAEPVVRECLTMELGPQAILADMKDSGTALLALLRQAPENLRRAERMIDELEELIDGGLTVADESVERLSRAGSRFARAGRISLWIIAACAVWIAWQVT